MSSKFLSFLFVAALLMFGAGHVFGEKLRFSMLEVAQAKSQSKKKKSAKKPRNIYKHPTVKKIIKRRGKRLTKINEFKKQGLIGESEDGLLRIRTLKRIPASTQESLKKFLRAENEDRNRLYQIVMKVDRFTKKQEPVFRESMFETYIKKDPPGTYYFEKKYWRKK